jgi:very-short-patch-repair endonuclease
MVVVEPPAEPLFPWLQLARQEPIGRYYVDFVCRERRLVVEVDGGQHSESAEDCRRDGDLTRLGYRVTRFWNNDVINNIDGVLRALLAELQR